MTTATEHVERDARRIIDEARGTIGLHANIAREIALVLEGIERTRALHRWHEEQLLADECSIGNDLSRVTHFAPLYSREEATLHARLLALGAERRRLATMTAERLAEQHRVLLDLVHRYRLLTLDDD